MPGPATSNLAVTVVGGSTLALAPAAVLVEVDLSLAGAVAALGRDGPVVLVVLAAVEVVLVGDVAAGAVGLVQGALGQGLNLVPLLLRDLAALAGAGLVLDLHLLPLGFAGLEKRVLLLLLLVVVLKIHNGGGGIDIPGNEAAGIDVAELLAALDEGGRAGGGCGQCGRAEEEGDRGSEGRETHFDGL
ncbi:hypothetical protein PG990_004017 [Apiospora arundinis]